ncbi:MAG: phage terminase large subunit family protein [Minisyncoccota bacterium]
MEPKILIPEEELQGDLLIKAAAIDSDFYGRHFFPKACRQKTPGFHKEIDDVIERPENRFVAIESYRGSAKTTRLRIFTSKRIAYGISRTILYMSDTETHAAKSLEWIKRNVEHNTLWARTYQLSPGKKWTETDIEIVHGAFGHTVRVLALGITGQVRGINIDDHRPDLIVGDDLENEENTATPEQRGKISKLFFGAVEKSLVPASENIDAKLVLLGTPLHRDALVEVCRQDQNWVSRRYSCFDTRGQSRWEDRFSTEVLLRDKQSHIQRNQLHLWMREMECKVVATETCYFKLEWLRYWEVLPDNLTVVIGIDPASSDSPDADFQAVIVLGIAGKRRYIMEYEQVRGQDPDELMARIIPLIKHHRPISIGVETVAYQKTLKSKLEKTMKAHGIYVPVEAVNDKRKKRDRIRQVYGDLAAYGNLYVNKSHLDFIQQFGDYPDVTHEDLLDAGAIAEIAATPFGFTQEIVDADWKPISSAFQGCP